MNISNSTTSLPKYKRLSLQDYEYIIRKVTKHDTLHAFLSYHTPISVSKG